MEQQIEKNIVEMPILVMRGMVLFPKIVLHFDVGRDRSISALNYAMDENDRIIFLTSQKNIEDDDPDVENINKIGVVAEIKQIVKSKGYLRVLVEGQYRANIDNITSSEPFYRGNVKELPTGSAKIVDKTMIEALVRTVKDLFREYTMRTPRMAKELILGALNSEDPLYLSEYITSNLPINFKDKQRVLEESKVIKRLELLIEILEKENEILLLEQEIHEKVRGQIDSNQREFYLREQIRVISEELGDGSNLDDEIYNYQTQIEELNLAEEISEKLFKELDKLSKMPPNSHESGVIRSWLDSCLELPWNKSTKDRNDIKVASRQLEKDHYGMKKVKERILELIAVRKLAPDQKGQIICLVGPPGVGKTSIARSVAESMNRQYVRISLGGVKDESDIRGHRKTYIGAMPGRIIASLQQVNSKNPLMLLDEVDKLGANYRDDPSSALLEVLDSEQNFAFRDHYIEVPFDLSQVLFVATANNLATIPGPLRDRMEIIELSSYTREEKFEIAKRHLIPKQLTKHGLTKVQANFTKNGIYTLIDYYTKEAGVRSLEREIASVLRKVAKDIVAEEIDKTSLNQAQIEKYLGGHKFKESDIAKNNQVGLVNGLAWTSVGGEMLQVEVAILAGSGKTVLTGSLGDVMKESAQAAISFVRSCVDCYGIDPEFYKTKDIHVHVPEGAVPKDGPSAGVTLVTALVSALSGLPVYGSIAMTGEISLRGRVLPIGGLREKAMAAYRNGIKTVIIPEDNFSDLEEVDDVVKENIKFVTAKTLDDVLTVAIVGKEKK